MTEEEFEVLHKKNLEAELERRFNRAFKLLCQMQEDGEYIVDINNRLRRECNMIYSMRNGSGRIDFLLTDISTRSTKKYKL